ncbi:MAG: hypothetical protein ACR2QO_17455 [Acidimicrobiales bacterium]
MASGPLHRCLVAARSSITGEFSSTSRIVDTLLDLRQLAGAESATATMVDSLLASMPGRTVVANEWWRSALESIEGAGETDELRPATAVDV